MKKVLSTLFLFLAIPTFLLAHEEGGSGFIAGITHPVLGLDHLLAMVSVGILSAQLGGKAIWTVPAAFVSVMLLGGLLGIGNDPLPFVEQAIATSVVILGIAIALDRKLPVWIALIAVGFFGFFHGHAHGVEMPGLARPVLYAMGFIIGTTSIHVAGVGIGFLSTRDTTWTKVLRFSGAFMAGMGMQMLLG